MKAKAEEEIKPFVELVTTYQENVITEMRKLGLEPNTQS